MFHRFMRQNPLCRVILQHPSQEVQGLRRGKVFIFLTNKPLPGFLHMFSHHFPKYRAQFYFILIKIPKQFLCAQDLCDFHELVLVIPAMEERVFLENNPREHGPETPHVQRVVVEFVIHQQLRAFEVPRGHPHVVLGSGVVELREAPVDQS